MRARLITAFVIIVVGALAIAGWRLYSSSQTVAQAPVGTATPMLVQNLPSASPQPGETGAESAQASLAPGVSGSPGASPSDEGTPAAGETPGPTEAPTDSPTPVPTATATIPAEPTGLASGWEQMSERTVGGREADLLVRTGDINNLGFGWPAHFTPFSGKSTPPHPWLCNSRPGAPVGTDRSMLGTGVRPQESGAGDGYSGCSTRPDNLPQAISIVVGDLPSKVHVVLLQMFADDFQPMVWGSRFQVSLDGTRLPNVEDTINALDQTGPIGKLITMRLLPEYVPLLRSGTVDLLIDDPTTHKKDGYAVDFVRILVNPHAFQYAVTIACTIVAADTQLPIKGATCASAQVTGTTGALGTVSLRGVPAGMASVSADAVGYDGAVQLLDLPVGTPGIAHFVLKKHHEAMTDLQQQIKQNGSVAIYGIHFDTASAKLRPDSIASLETVLQLVKSEASQWIIAGHTDNQGGAAYNLDLSRARAKSVVAWLTQHGIPANRLLAQGFGLTRPVADNDTASGRALNRRVEVKLVK
jgi:OmpA-OmpF porin, OOP family